MKNWKLPFRILCMTLAIIAGALSAFSGVSRTIQDQYRKQYENKAMFLKIPVYAERQVVYITGQTFRVDRGTGALRYKVGDQLRILAIDFGNEEIKFRLGSLGAAGFVDLIFRFDSSLQESFPNREVFDRALESSLTEGLKYTDIDDAKDSFVREQFERAVKEIAGTASISRESVLKTIAPYVPAYQDAQRDIDSLRSKLQNVSDQLSQTQSENRKLESDLRAQQTESSRLKRENAAIQDKLDNYTQQVSKLGDEVRDAKGSAQGYQKELANIQRSLNLRVDTGRDLAAQLTDLGQAMRKMQRDNESLINQNSSMRTNLQAGEATNARLVAENQDLKANNHKLQINLSDVTSKGDSLGKKYIDLKNEKEKLDDYSQSLDSLRTRVVEESTEGGNHYGKANVYLKDVLLGSLTWSIPGYLNRDETKTGEVSFSTESIDYVRVTPGERHILRSLGDRYKVRIDLASGSDSMTVTPDENQPVREIGERDHSTWKWRILNRGAKDSRLILTAALINKDSNQISILQHEPSVIASNMIRQARAYLQPVPLLIGIALGLVLFGIIGIFRRPKSHIGPPRNTSAASSEPPANQNKKQL